MKRKGLTLLLIILCIALVSATIVLFAYPYSPNSPPMANDTGSTTEGIQKVVNANNQFAFDYYSQLDKIETGNIFYSPYSISTAIVMTYEGAKGQTAEEMQSVFHFPESEILRPNSAAIYNGLNKDKSEYLLSTGNALWVQQNFTLLDNYTNSVENYYGGKTANVDFAGETEKTRQTINSFIGEQTNDKIQELIPKNVLSSRTRLVLTNAIYFKGTWEWEFKKSETQELDFKIAEGNIVKTPTMHMKPEKATFNYVNLKNLQIIELPYKGEDISMLILLPKEDLNSLGEITNLNLEDWKNQMEETTLSSISLPKFKFDTKYFMKEALEEMGMSTAFQYMNADFSGMTGGNELYISSVIHQAFIEVDEKGTEAAAATAVIMEGESTSASPKIFKADHPFIFIIQEKETGNILFLGRVVDPRV